MRFPVLGLDECGGILGSGAVLYRSDRCVTLHAVGAAQPRTIMPHARGVAPARRDPPETRQLLATKEDDGRAPRTAVGGDAACGNPFDLRGNVCLRPDLDAVRRHPGLNVAPERDQQLPRHCHDGDPPRAPL
jgi:hypothetical protein